ncbi:DUF2141 domain-containing protein [Sphingomonas morindae]|uniref:DUF2141 domain-containing protein n=1 Tax=Sphingomonas morindae TaxID=1541170 RepID=A0ABY4X4A2_9SPHN|nr:DUF2141 domain-containing protein [Sphingomonas morindae]USI71672.1 DUF2141 domain-containing protein [Sphingomonas morindae]
MILSRPARLLALAGLAGPLAAFAPPGPAAPIIVAVSNVPSAQGRVHVDICPEAKFVTDDCPYMAEAPAVAGTTYVTVPAVPPGRYAAQAYHDKNGNGRTDRNFLGIPTERVGFSNDAPVHFGPPHFADAAFDHGTTPQRLAFRVRSLP